MKSGIAIFVAFFSINTVVLFAQTTSNTKLNFQPKFGNADLQLNDAVYTTKINDSIWIDVFKCYVSNIALLQNGKVVWQKKNSFHLINIANQQSLQLMLQTPAAIAFDAIQFNVGIDSVTNVSGAMGGDLDPTNGMYWTWQSGYINIKLEGRSNKCLTRNNAFTFHLGGYQYPFNALQKIIIPIEQKEKINIIIDVQKFISSIDLTSQNQIMSPGKSAMLLSNQFSTIFSELKQ
jgi:hypothetical protein